VELHFPRGYHPQDMFCCDVTALVDSHPGTCSPNTSCAAVRFSHSRESSVSKSDLAPLPESPVGLVDTSPRGVSDDVYTPRQMWGQYCLVVPLVQSFPLVNVAHFCVAPRTSLPITVASRCIRLHLTCCLVCSFSATCSVPVLSQLPTDLGLAYHQIPLLSEEKHCTAFEAIVANCSSISACSFSATCSVPVLSQFEVVYINGVELYCWISELTSMPFVRFHTLSGYR